MSAHITEEIKIYKLEIRILRHSEIWYGKTRKEIMEKLDPRKHCKFHCIRHETNKLLDEVAAGKKIDKVPDYDRFM